MAPLAVQSKNVFLEGKSFFLNMYLSLVTFVNFETVTALFFLLAAVLLCDEHRATPAASRRRVSTLQLYIHTHYDEL